MKEKKKRTVLIVDDDKFAAMVLQKQLESGKPQAQITVYIESRAAVSKLAAGEKVDLLFLDLRMPDIDGITFVRSLTAAAFRGGLVFCSGQSDRLLLAAQEIAQNQGINVMGTLQKPPSLGQLQALLARASQPTAREFVAVSSADLQLGLSKGEIVNYDQPKVSLSDRSLHGVEALVRWQTPNGIVSPDNFIPIAESSGLVGALTDRVIEEALLDLSNWQRKGIVVEMSINLSVAGLTDLALPEQLASRCQASNIENERITLELTESKVMDKPGETLDILSRLHLMGFNLSIDDFGTGYSSLTQLSRAPFNELKIDRSFVRNAANQKSSQAIINSSVSLARDLQMRIVAEGVETQDDWALVKAAGCDFAQGYFIARPMPADDIPPWVVEWQSGR